MIRRLTPAAALAGTLVVAGPAVAQTTIHLDGHVAMGNDPGATVPAGARLSDAFLSQGVRFSSGSPFVAVVFLGPGHAPSGTLGIGGTTPGGALWYFEPIFIDFFDPLDPTRAATTDLVSIRADLAGTAAFVSLVAFDVDGNVLDSDTQLDAGGPLLRVDAPGIRRVQIVPDGSSAFGDLTFGPLTPVVTAVPEPATWATLATGLAVVAAAARRRHPAARR